MKTRELKAFPTDQELTRRGFDPVIVGKQRQLVKETNDKLDEVRKSELPLEEKKAKIAEIKSQHELMFKAIK